MDDLNAYGTQPDYGRAMYNPRPQDDFDGMTQDQLDTFTQAYMEKAQDFISESWLEVRIRWGVNNDIHISTTESTVDQEVDLPISFSANTRYLMTTDVIDDSVRVRIFPLNVNDSIDRESILFDSNEVRNDFIFKRRKGRLGWAIDLQDGDSYVESIRSRGLLYGEWLSQNYESHTPVEGARLFVGATPDIKTPLASLPYNGSTITVDTFTTRSSDGSAKVVADTDDGLVSRPVPIEDFENSLITFDLFYPKTALDEDSFPELYLLNELGYMIRIGMPGITGDIWNQIRVRPLLASLEQTGPYQVLIKQDTGSATFWVDNFIFQQRSVRWEGRSTYNDPWGRNHDDWTEFGDFINSETNGIMFPERGSFLQVRGQSLTQHASIDKLYIKPKYSQLGRLTWNANRGYRVGTPQDSYS
jgi:hypothetical protein